jgi:hypothetical protein
MIEKEISTWFSRLAWIGVWTKTIRLSYRRMRWTDAWPRCEEPLSTMKNNCAASL